MSSDIRQLIDIFESHPIRHIPVRCCSHRCSKLRYSRDLDNYVGLTSAPLFATIRFLEMGIKLGKSGKNYRQVNGAGGR
jgi:hypothetical protein